mmetsp:Transcript_31762/g.80795  ORF Transcript_31762/g.80795 Transcript_31762/m.80795 type:complete len:337 (+) Transcript_31762:5309-6319(+)
MGARCGSTSSTQRTLPTLTSSWSRRWRSTPHPATITLRGTTRTGGRATMTRRRPPSTTTMWIPPPASPAPPPPAPSWSRPRTTMGRPLLLWTWLPRTKRASSSSTALRVSLSPGRPSRAASLPTVRTCPTSLSAPSTPRRAPPSTPRPSRMRRPPPSRRRRRSSTSSTTTAWLQRLRLPLSEGARRAAALSPWLQRPPRTTPPVARCSPIPVRLAPPRPWTTGTTGSRSRSRAARAWGRPARLWTMWPPPAWPTSSLTGMVRRCSPTQRHATQSRASLRRTATGAASSAAASTSLATFGIRGPQQTLATSMCALVKCPTRTATRRRRWWASPCAQG